MTRSSVDAFMAEMPAEPETLRDLMRQPGMSIGAGLIALGFGGLLLAVFWLCWMPPSNRLGTHTAEAPAEHSLEKPRPAASASGALVQHRSAGQPSEAVALPPAALRETAPPEPAQTEPATAEHGAAAAPPPSEPAPSSQPAPTAAAAEIAQPPAPPAAAAAAPPPDAVAATAPDAVTAPAPDAVTAPAPDIVAAPPPTEAKGYRLQLGAMRTPERAKQEWARLQHQHGDLLAKLAYAAPRVDLGSRGVFYRIQAGPLADAATAGRACGELKRRGVGCIIVKP